MMSTNNENYVNDVNGAIFTSGTSSGRGAPRDSQVVVQRNPYGVRVLGRVARSKNKRQSPPASPSGSSTNVPATRLERLMEAAESIRTRDNVAHSRVNHHQLLLGNWNILTLTGKELELVEEAKRYHLDIIGVSSTKRRGSRTVDRDGGWKLFYSGADPSMSAQAGVGILTSPRLSDCVSDWIPLGSRVCMLKLKVLDQSLCLLQVYAPNATSEYQTFVDEVNDALLRVSAAESTFLWGILTHMLEQTQIRGRVWSENMESLDWMRTEGIYCSSVVATDSASWIPFSSTERFTSIHGIDLVWIKNLW